MRDQLIEGNPIRQGKSNQAGEFRSGEGNPIRWGNSDQDDLDERLGGGEMRSAVASPVVKVIASSVAMVMTHPESRSN